MFKLIRNLIILFIVVVVGASAYFFYVAEYRQAANDENYTYDVPANLKPLVDDYLSQYQKNGQKVQVENEGLKLKGEYVSNETTTDKTVIVIHGFRVNRTIMYRYSDEFLKMGYNVLTVDDRAHGKSEGKYIGYGYKDKDDIQKWIDYLIEQNPKTEIAIYGASMGGATVAELSGESLQTNVKALIEDSGYSSINKEVEYQAGQQYAFLKPVAKPLVYLVSLWSKMLAGYSYSDGNALNQVKKNKLPMFFMHGGQDDFVPTKMVYELYNADPDDRKDLWIAGKSKHVDSLADYPEEWFSQVKGFLDKYFN